MVNLQFTDQILRQITQQQSSTIVQPPVKSASQATTQVVLQQGQALQPSTLRPILQPSPIQPSSVQGSQLVQATNIQVGLAIKAKLKK